MLWCPSDSVITNLQFTYPAGTVMATPLTMYYSSYAGNTGTVVPVVRPDRRDAAAAAACQFGTGYPDTQTNGLIYMLSSVSLAGVTDGTSNTLLAGERAHGKFPSQDLYCWNWWTSGNFGDTLFTAFYPINPFNKIPDFCCLDSGPDAYVASAASFHPGGANFGFADGSVKFLKDSISTWQIARQRRHDDSRHRRRPFRRQSPSGGRLKRLSRSDSRAMPAAATLTRRACSSASIKPSRLATAARSSAPTSIEQAEAHQVACRPMQTPSKRRAQAPPGLFFVRRLLTLSCQPRNSSDH